MMGNGTLRTGMRRNKRFASTSKKMAEAMHPGNDSGETADKEVKSERETIGPET